jgi:hypothetical protein
MILLWLAGITGLARADLAWPYSICMEGGAYQVNGVFLGAVPTRNANDTFRLTGTAGRDLAMRNADLEVRLNGLHLDSINISYGASYDQGDKTTFLYTNFVPSFAPAGTYTLIFNFKTKSDERVGCVTTQFKL